MISCCFLPLKVNYTFHIAIRKLKCILWKYILYIKKYSVRATIEANEALPMMNELGVRLFGFKS